MISRMLIKIGGRAFQGAAGFKKLAHAIIKNSGVETIIVHGGGAEISHALAETGRETIFVDGIRVTHLEDIKIVENVLSQKVNKRIATYLEQNGVVCQRMSGKTDGLFLIEPLRREGLDFGYVGTIKSVDARPVFKALAQGKTPVVSPISTNQTGDSYNVNADNAAAALAVATKCTDLVYFTDVPGIRMDNMFLTDLTVARARTLIDEGVIKGGMVAKMNSVFTALDGGVNGVHIAQWQGLESLSAIIRKEVGYGTTVRLSQSINGEGIP